MMRRFRDTGLLSMRPNILDANGGGAGILAWRDIIRAEWELMVPDHPAGECLAHPLVR
jgi:hypothetical protein